MMKFITVLMFLVSAVAYADPNCAALSSAVGTYKQISANCQLGPMGTIKEKSQFIVVSPFQYTDKGTAYSAFWILVADPGTPTMGTGIGPGSGPDDTFQCTTTGNTISVGGLGSQLNFAGPNLTISTTEGCDFRYSRVN